MKVSYYELLGMIKDGNNPLKVIFDKNIYDFVCEDRYVDIKNNKCLSECFFEKEMFIKNIEIIENPKQIEELESYISTGFNGKANAEDVFNICEIMGDKINELIEAVNELKAKE